MNKAKYYDYLIEIFIVHMKIQLIKFMNFNVHILKFKFVALLIFIHLQLILLNSDNLQNFHQ